LFTLGSFLKITELAHIFFGHFSPLLRICIHFDKQLFVYILDDFFLKLIWSLWKGGIRAEAEMVV
jgi:hypothetical protein